MYTPDVHVNNGVTTLPHDRIVLAWLLKQDTGASSRAIASRVVKMVDAGIRPAIPNDANDLKLCDNLRQLLPDTDFFDAIDHLAKTCNYWAALRIEWSELTACMRVEFRNGDSHTATDAAIARIYRDVEES